MARGQDTGSHFNRQVGRGSAAHSWNTRQSSYGGVPTSKLDEHLGSAPFHGEKVNEYYGGALDSYKKSNARKVLDNGRAPFHGEQADQYYASEADAQGKGNMYPWGRG